ncbi:MAG: DUF6146 family protein [Bacteroidota bacterium]|nr:DUF6146 family protein [Bacteroidota bacterium]
MKTLFVLMIFMAGYFSMDDVLAQQNLKDSSSVEINSEDSTEYELLVLDAGFENYLLTVPHPKNFYSNEYYKNWNIQYCNEWNRRHQNPFRYGDFYETQINYEPSVDYGIDLNYKLYYYFQYIEDKYGIVLIRRKGK